MAFSSKSFAIFALAIAMAGVAATTTVAQNTAEDFVRLHNEARAEVNVGPVTWDDDLARYAQEHAAGFTSSCRPVHSGGPYGENYAWNTDPAFGAAGAVAWWVAEKGSYHYDDNSCDAGKTCLHYTQVVWRATTRIGCAHVVCDAGGGAFAICNYDPPGNYNGERPY